MSPTEAVPAPPSGSYTGTTAEAAIAYATRHGWAVLPIHSAAGGRCSCDDAHCRSPGKHPRTANGVKEASSDPGQVQRWWERWPDANIGVATGQASGIVVVDIDGPAGEAALADLGGNPPTPCSETTKGRHLIFAAPPFPVSNAVGLEPELDIRGDGGYFVAPPSVHASGHRYRWEDDLGFGIDDLDPVPLPAKLREAIRVKATVQHRGNNLADLAAIPEGTRNDSLTRLAGRLLGKGMSPSDTLGVCQAINTSKCLPPLQPTEVASIVRSIASREASKHQDEASAGSPRWPDPPAAAANQGLAGEVVSLIAPHSEGDKVALLVQFLTAFGNCLHRGPHFVVEADRHPMNLFILLVGPTAKGRKGSSWGQIRRILAEADPDWTSDRIRSGLSSGEGLIWQVRDPIEKQEPIREKGRITGYQTVIDDQGVSDKRLLVLESEFASTLKVMRREGNILSAVIRQAWDSGDLRVLTKNSPAQATGAHISIVGHITGDELRRILDQTDIANGFLNRFLVICVRRSQYLPRGGSLENIAPTVAKVRQALDFGRKVDRLEFDDAAFELWDSVYPELSEGKPGLLGAITSRGEAQVRRLACLYAILDSSPTVQPVHLEAALALWRYAEGSARFVFGDALGDPVGDQLLEAIRGAPAGLTRTQIRDHFSGHQGPAWQRALRSLEESGLVTCQLDPSKGGRRAERWVATEATKVPPSRPFVASVAGTSGGETHGDAWEPPNPEDGDSSMRATENPTTP